MTTVAEPDVGDPVGYSRVTLIGERRRADLVLPSAEPVGALLPEILAILEEGFGGPPRRIAVATAAGNLLSPDLSLHEAGIVDGAVLRVVTEDEIPPPPVVNDVTEETASDLERHPGRWTRSARMATTAALAAAELVIGEPAERAFARLAVAAAVCWVLGLASGLLRQRWIGVACIACGSVLAAGLAAVGPDAHRWTTVDRIGALLAAGWAGVGLVGLVTRRRGPGLGAVVGLAFAALWVVLRHSPLHSYEADAIVAVVAVVVLGLLPHWALNFSGLASLDDRRLAGDQVPRRALESSLLVAHTGLVWSSIAVSGAFGIAAAALAVSDKPWALGLAGAGALVVILRARVLPLTVEVVASLVAAAAVVAMVEFEWLDGGHRLSLALGSTALLAVLVIASMALDPPAHIRARMRGLADRAEALAVLCLIPLLVGIFGVYGRLLHTF